VNYSLEEYARCREPDRRGLQRPERAPPRHRDRVGPGAHRAPLGAGLQRARTNEILMASSRKKLAKASIDHPASSSTPTRASRARTSRSRTTTPPAQGESIGAFNLGVLDLRARARVESCSGHVREDPEDRPRAGVRARRAGEPGEAPLGHLLLQLLAVPVAARPLGGAPALPHAAAAATERGPPAPRGARGPHLRQRRQDGPVHRPQGRARPPQPAQGERRAVLHRLLPDRAYQEILGDCTTCSATQTPSTCASTATTTGSSTWWRATR